MEDATETTELDEQERLTRDQQQYHRGNKLVSREEFYKYGFPHEQRGRQTNCCTEKKYHEISNI